MKRRITIDSNDIARKIAEQCFLERDDEECLHNFLTGAAYAVGFALSRNGTWNSGDFVAIGREMTAIGHGRYQELLLIEESLGNKKRGGIEGTVIDGPAA
ncbi:MAG: hypothetical protein ABF876_19550 [Acetobacter aceti]|uniref:Uncharacterized protein n=1 Tax=Acetobacter aceti TaxID=435 RepID=A0A1U9KFL3_ACEAC|nr:hypothetical protein [Acetobacter aceti]AQS84594.1 hypothetical protein A0U92_07165 [Acetobacter aceti]